MQGMRIVFTFDQGQLRNIRALVRTVDEQRLAGNFIARIASSVEPDMKKIDPAVQEHK
jgi:hypothetical protein